MLLAGRRIVVNGHVLPLEPRRAARVVVVEVRAMPLLLRAWLGALLGVAAVAGVAALIALPPGWEVFGTTPTFEWGLLIVGYVFFAIMTSGLCLASSLGTVFGIDRFRPLEKRHAILAVLSLTAAFGIIALDLHYPVRMVLGAVLSPTPTSPMWWMGVFYGGYLVILLVEVWSMFWDHPVIHAWACTAAAGMAVVAPFTLGAVFAVLAARPSWHGPFTPVLMVATAFLAGTALLTMAFAVVGRLGLAGHERSERLAVPGLRLLLGGGLLVVGVLVARSVLVGLGGGERGLREATEAVISGPLAPTFWLVRVGLGLAVPLVLVGLPVAAVGFGRLRIGPFRIGSVRIFRGSGWLGLAGACALVGVLADRFLFVSGGQIAPVTASAGVVTQGFAFYAPSLVEVGIVAGAAAYVALGYTLAERYLDLRESDVHVGFVLAPVARGAWRLGWAGASGAVAAGRRVARWVAVSAGWLARSVARFVAGEASGSVAEAPAAEAPPSESVGPSSGPDVGR
jgi:molybdopterin-containing oxidoreductase family membrane subunit